MAHEHVHDQNFYLDQLCTIGVSGLLGSVAFFAWSADIFDKFSILAPQFKTWVLFGSVALLVLSVVRGVTLWVEVGRKKSAGSHTHDHSHGDHSHQDEHVHGPNCDHEHDHKHEHAHVHGPNCDHDHDHKHDHAHQHGPDCDHDHAPGEEHSHDFAPWRYAVLLMPLMLSALLLYYHFAGLNLSFSPERLSNSSTLGKDGSIDVGGVSVVSQGKIRATLPEMVLAASTESGRSVFEGKTATLRGLYLPLNAQQCTLFRMKITCCASDMVPSGVRIVAPADLPEKIPSGEKIEATGVVRFLQPQGKSEYIPVLLLSSVSDLVVRKDIPFAEVVDR